jgi:hypothetical protein
MKAHTASPLPSWSPHQGALDPTACRPCFGATSIGTQGSLSAQALAPCPQLSAPTSPVQQPEIVDAICSELDLADLATAAMVNRAWHAICVPILYQEIVLCSRTFKINSLILGVRRYGNLCRKLKATREVVGNDLLSLPLYSISNSEAIH